jgi:hypothetical protein
VVFGDDFLHELDRKCRIISKNILELQNQVNIGDVVGVTDATIKISFKNPFNLFSEKECYSSYNFTIRWPNFYQLLN